MKKIKMGSGGKMHTVPISELLVQRIEFQTITNNTPLLAFTIAEGVINPEDKKSNKRDFLMKDKDNKRFELTEKDDIIYNPANVVFGAIHRNALGKGVVSPIYKIFKCVNVDPLYMDCVVSRASFIHELSKYAEGSVTKLRTLAPESFLNLELTVPTDVDEQHKIGILIESLKTKIENEKKQTEKIKVLKKSMLDKMFPKEGETEPEIRFPGFTDAWEQRKLGDAFERVVRKNTNNESRLPLTISAQDGLVDQITYFNNRVASRDVSNYYLVYNGEFAYNKSTSDGYPFGAVKRLDWYEKGVLSTLYIVFALKHPEKDDSDFMTVFYDTDRWHRGVAERAAEGARNHGLLNISADDFFDIDTTMPEDKVEQEKIGRLLKKLDTLITLHQRKYEKLIDTKKHSLKN